MAYDVILNVAAEVSKKRSESGVPINPDDTVCALRTNTGNIYTGINRLEVHNGMVNVIHAEIDAINNMKSNNESIIESITVLNSYTLSPILPCNNCINTIISINPQNIKCIIVTPVQNIPLTAVNQFVSNNVSSVNPNVNPAVHNNVSAPPNTNMTGYQPYSGSVINRQVNESTMYNNSVPARQFNPNSQVNVSMTSMQMSGNNNINTPMTSNQLNQSRMDNSLYSTSRQTSSLYTPDTTKSSKGEQLKSKINNLLNDDIDEDEENDEDENDMNRKKNKKRFGGLFG